VIEERAQQAGKFSQRLRLGLRVCAAVEADLPLIAVPLSPQLVRVGLEELDAPIAEKMGSSLF
jgi:hypothetical protein